MFRSIKAVAAVLTCSCALVPVAVASAATNSYLHVTFPHTATIGHSVFVQVSGYSDPSDTASNSDVCNGNSCSVLVGVLRPGRSCPGTMQNFLAINEPQATILSPDSAGYWIAPAGHYHRSWPTPIFRKPGTYAVCSYLFFGDGLLNQVSQRGTIHVTSPACTVPMIVGLPAARAETIILSSGCTIGNVTYVTTHHASPGKVVSVSPIAGTTRPLHAPIAITVARA